MPKLLFSEFSLSQMQRFIHLYEEGFFTLYKNSGVWAEDTIYVRNYERCEIFSRDLNKKIVCHRCERRF